ncbi:MAG: DNA repair protein RecO [Fusobacterium sp.]|uniref:DNA repair protein RecO n=1 Tax=Fusobacterium sp. TaxID=68766 RepID=UPI0026DC2BC1|nr:DNA repair protein RecO [Fusobacterium sp.]MDO4691184.1 DNA repair protein RecO [Fusobacterium sp.]
MIFLRGNGIVISKKEIEEADRYITVFMEDFGKISILVKGIRKSKKRDKTAVDIISLTDFTFYRKGENIIISEFNGIEGYREIKNDLEKLKIVFYIFSILNQILVENGRNRKIYNLLKNSLAALNKSKERKKDLLMLAYFIYEIIKDEGIVPEERDSSIFFFNKNLQKENMILKALLNDSIKELVRNNDYEIEEVKKVINILERYINVNLDLKLDAKRFLWGDFLC